MLWLKAAVVQLLAVLSICAAAAIELTISSDDILSHNSSSDISSADIHSKNASPQIFVKDNANLTLRCIGSKANGTKAPDLMIGGNYVTTDGNPNDVSTYDAAFAGAINVTFNDKDGTTKVTIQNLTQIQNSSELNLKCLQTRVGVSDPLTISIFSSEWSGWTCDVENCRQSRIRDCLDEAKDECEMNENGCDGNSQQCSVIPSAEEIKLTQVLISASEVTVTVSWVPSFPGATDTVSGDFTAQVNISGGSGTSSKPVKLHQRSIKFDTLEPNTPHNVSIVYSNAVKRAGEKRVIKFNTLSRYLEMLPYKLNKNSDLTISWKKVEGCEGNNATVTIKTSNAKSMTNPTVANIGPDTFISFAYDQTKAYNISVVSRGCGDILSPGNGLNLEMDAVKAIITFRCDKTADSKWKREDGTYTVQTVKCQYNIRVDLNIDCNLGDKIIEGAPFEVTKAEGFVSIDVVACKNKQMMLCRAKTKSGATLMRKVVLPAGNGDRACVPLNGGDNIRVIRGYFVVLVLLYFAKI